MAIERKDVVRMIEDEFSRFSKKNADQRFSTIQEVKELMLQSADLGMVSQIDWESEAVLNMIEEKADSKFKEEREELHKDAEDRAGMLRDLDWVRDNMNRIHAMVERQKKGQQ